MYNHILPFFLAHTRQATPNQDTTALAYPYLPDEDKVQGYMFFSASHRKTFLIKEHLTGKLDFLLYRESQRPQYISRNKTVAPPLTHPVISSLDELMQLYKYNNGNVLREQAYVFRLKYDAEKTQDLIKQKRFHEAIYDAVSYDDLRKYQRDADCLRLGEILIVKPEDFQSNSAPTPQSSE